MDEDLHNSLNLLFLRNAFKNCDMAKGQLGRSLIARGLIDTKSVSTPPAQYAKLLQDNSVEVAALKTLQRIASEGLSKWGHFALGVDLMLSGGLRVSELVSADVVLVNANGQVLIKGRKGSADRLVTPLYQREYWMALRGWVHNPCSVVSRFSWYRFLKAQGIVLHENGHIHNSVTHAPRKLFAHQLFAAGVASQSVADVVGHRSSRSTEYYRPQ